jgi:hypothetical protein
MSSDGIVAQAADLTVMHGAAYLPSAGNQAHECFESVDPRRTPPFARYSNGRAPLLAPESLRP